MRTEGRKLTPESREWLNRLRAARVLGHQTDPAVARQGGLQSALGYLGRGTELAVDFAAGLPNWTVLQCVAACGMVRDFILAIPRRVAWRPPKVA